MRARTIITILAFGALAIPASAIGYESERHSSVNAITGGSSDSSQPTGGTDYSSATAIAPPSSEQSGSAGSADVGPGTSSLNAVVGPSPGGSPSPAASPAGTADGFHWGDAALGAGTALALVALGGAAFLTVRTRTAVSPSAASSG